MKYSLPQFVIIAIIYSIPVLVLVAAIEIGLGWFSGATPTEIATSFVVQAVLGLITIIIGALQIIFGPDWREGMRRYEERRAVEEWHVKERERQRREYGEEWPSSIWWPPHDIMPDGSCPRLGTESDHMKELRRRWPAWFDYHGV